MDRRRKAQQSQKHPAFRFPESDESFGECMWVEMVEKEEEIASAYPPPGREMGGSNDIKASAE